MNDESVFKYQLVLAFMERPFALSAAIGRPAVVQCRQGLIGNHVFVIHPAVWTTDSIVKEVFTNSYVQFHFNSSI